MDIISFSKAKKAEQKADIVQTQLNQAIADGDQLAETQQARVDADGNPHITLKNRIDSDVTTSRQAESELNTRIFEQQQVRKSIEVANSEQELEIVNYLGNTRNIHPKVLEFNTTWNGYKYWMGYTPYVTNKEENPSIAVSNDKTNWTVPAGLVNPIYPTPSDGFNADTHLVYREDTDTLEIWWRTYSGGVLSTYRKTTTDGKTFETEELLYTATTTSQLSPSVIYEDGLYKHWAVTDGDVVYMESADAKNWTTPTVLEIEWGSLSAWHLDVIRTDLGYEMVVCAYDLGGDERDCDLYYLIQKPDGTFTTPELILKRSTNSTAIDSKTIYRSSLLKSNGVYHLFYSSWDSENKTHIALSSGDNILGLNGFRDVKKIPVNRKMAIEGGSVLSLYDVSEINVMAIRGSTPVTINSLIGGYVGKTLAIVLEGSNASALIKYNTKMVTPSRKDYTLTTKEVGLFLVCTEIIGAESVWRVIAPPIEFTVRTDRVVTIEGGQTISNYNVGAVDSIVVTGTSPLIIDRFIGGYLGQKVTVVLAGSSASATFNYAAGKMITPSLVNFDLTTEKMGLDVICTDATAQTWRVMA